MAMKIFSLVCVTLAMVLITMDSAKNSASACYSPKDNEWLHFVQSRNYKGVCNSSGNGCASTCAGEGMPGGRCVKTGSTAFDCKCFCNKK